MKRLSLIVVIITTLFCSGCKKSSGTPGTDNIPAAGWRLNTTNYATVYCVRGLGGISLSAMDGTPVGSDPHVNTCNVFFKSYPTTNGTYKIVFYAGGVTLANGEIGISAGLYSPGKTYVSEGTDNITATVTVTGGKLKVVIPEVSVKSTSGAETVKLSGTLTEN